VTQDEGKSPYKAFQPQDVEPKYARDRGFTVIDTTLDIKVDERAGTVEGKATLRVRPIVPVNTIELDAADMRINRVTVDKKPVRFEHDDDRLLVRTGRRLKEATEHDIVISYKATPRKGLYFVAPEGARKGLGWQVWSQGESEDNHHWFPGYDFPNNKATSDVRLTVRDPMRAISNGHLVATKKAGRGWTTYHWSQRVPQPNYLIAIVVGEFDEVSDEWDGIPLSYLVPKGKAAWAKETFKRTPEILAFFSRVTGYKYPYPKYTQAVIAEFMWGGMENTSLTTVNDRFLVLPEHRNDADPDGLVAHEAAHQWFGDLVTTKSWEHLWLNEAFATYFDALWHEDHYGADRLAYELMENAEAYFHEDSHEYRRALVTRGYRTNEDLFDRHTYQKGSFILHMLRQELGDDMWWRAIRHYVKANEWRNVETIDLKVAIEEATGRNVDAFFDQWVYRGGHPEFEASWSHDERHKQAKVTIKQTQKVVGETPRFRVKIKARVWIDDKKFKDETLEVSREEESFFLPSAKKPKAIELDPEGALLKKLKFERPVNEAVFVLSHAKSAIGRIEAAKALGKKPSDPESTQALAKAMSKDPFFGVRAACASALGEQGVEAARDALLAAKPDTDSRVRRHVADALGTVPQG
jgi:aminopeptidase N